MSPPLLPATTNGINAARSLVDVTARMSLVMAVLGVIYSVLQLGVILMLGMAHAGDWLRAQGLTIAASLQWLMDYAAALGLLMLLASLAFVVVSWGLLVRREWARIGFIGFLLLTALANFACLPLIPVVFSGLTGVFPADMLDTSDGRELLAQLQFSRWTTLIMASITALAFAALHGWLALKFTRPDVRAQFQ